jgi:hypothetical protein
MAEEGKPAAAAADPLLPDPRLTAAGAISD